MKGRELTRVRQGRIEAQLLIAQLTNAQVVIAMPGRNGLLLDRRESRTLRAMQRGTVTDSRPCRLGPHPAQAAILELLGQGVGVHPKGQWQVGQPLDADDSLCVTVPYRLSRAPRTGRLVSRPIRHVGQRLTLLVEQLKLDPVRYLFATQHILAWVERIGSVQGVVHITPRRPAMTALANYH
ncbi:hypothetical protein D3C77_391880 [compost metagenome]